MLGRGEAIGDNVAFNKLAASVLGKSTAKGEVTTEELFDYLEAAVALWVQANGHFLDSEDPAEALRTIARLMTFLPRNSTRGDEKDKFQQYSTPPTLSFAAVKAAGVQPGELAAEPSAGTAMLA